MGQLDKRVVGVAVAMVGLTLILIASGGSLGVGTGGLATQAVHVGDTNHDDIANAEPAQKFVAVASRGSNGEVAPDPRIFDDENPKEVPNRLDTRFYGKRGLVKRRLIPDLYMKKWQAAGCPDERWWEPVLRAKSPRPEDSGRNILRYAEVGVNKGYRLIWLIEAISGMKAEYSAKSLWDALLVKHTPAMSHGSRHSVRYMTKNLCGFCCDCNEESFRDEKNVASNASFLAHLDGIEVQAHAFDMNDANIDFLKGFTDKRGHKNVRITYHHAAVGNRKGLINSCKVAFAKESFGIDTPCDPKDKIKIPAVRLDDVLRNEQTHGGGNYDFMDFLLVDVEGYDVPVLMGARNIIEQRKVGIVMFELHGGDDFNKVYLDIFEKNDYTCFLTTQGVHGRHRTMKMPYLVQTNFGFQHRNFRQGKHWGNAICHQNIEPYVSIFAGIKDQLWPTSDLKCHYLKHREAELKRALAKHTQDTPPQKEGKE